MHFRTSPSGGLSGPGGSTITIDAPAGTVFPASGYSLVDTNTGGSYNGTITRSNANATVTITMNDTVDIPSGDDVLVTVNGVTNASATGPQTLDVTTSSDTTAGHGTFSLTP